MNPALPGGANDGPNTTGADVWSVQSRLAYTFVPYGRLQQGTTDAPNPNQLGIDVHLGSLQVTGTAPTGTSLDLQLPFGTLQTSTFDASSTSTGLGDLEVRFRQAARWWTRPRMAATLGVALPTGPYVPRSGAANLPPEALTLTLGRGTTWGIAELDTAIDLASGVTVFAQLSGRVPLSATDDGFAWGSELRGSFGGALRLSPRWSILASSDVQWRGGASEPDPSTMTRIESANAGGLWWSATPAVRAELVDGLAATAGVRFAVVADVTGNQLVPQTGGFVALTYTVGQAPRRAAPAPSSTPARDRHVPGSITVVDYWATWCAACKDIHADLEAAERRWPDVKIVRVDATSWPGPEAPPLPATVDGLPAIEVYRSDGSRIHLLVGQDARRVVEFVDNLRALENRR